MRKEFNNCVKKYGNGVVERLGDYLTLNMHELREDYEETLDDIRDCFNYGLDNSFCSRINKALGTVVSVRNGTAIYFAKLLMFFLAAMKECSEKLGIDLQEEPKELEDKRDVFPSLKDMLPGKLNYLINNNLSAIAKDIEKSNPVLSFLICLSNELSYPFLITGVGRVASYTLGETIFVVKEYLEVLL
jgi:hypothetical protein